jgi:hypothetical protein
VTSVVTGRGNWEVALGFVPSTSESNNNNNSTNNNIRKLDTDTKDDVKRQGRDAGGDVM